MPIERLSTGIDVNYEVRGAGTPVVFAAATGFSGDIWTELYDLDALAEHHTVVIFDQRGSGSSTHYDGVYTLGQMSSDVLALITHLDLGPVHLVGHSMGGRIGLELALNFPDLVSSLVLAATGSGPGGRQGGLECVPGIPVHFVDSLGKLGFDEYLRYEICDTQVYFSDAYREANPEKVQRFYELAVATIAPRTHYIKHVQARQTWETTHRLADLEVPALVMVGALDNVNSHVEQAEAFKKIPNVEFQFLEGQAHAFFWEDPEGTNAILLDWFARHEQKST